MGRLADKNILITGGNSGIGLAAAQEFYREGARVNVMSAFDPKRTFKCLALLLPSARQFCGATSLLSPCYCCLVNSTSR